MTLQQLRDLLRDYTGDEQQRWLTDARADRFLNAALRHVANWADSKDQGLFTGVASLTGLVNAAFVEIPFYSGSPNWGINATVNRFRRLIHVYRTNHPTASNQETQPVPIEDRFSHLPSSADAVPKIYVYGDGIGFINPAAGNYALTYVYSLGDMTATSDTPGQVSGAGTANALPVEYHPLIASRAAFLALLSEDAQAAAQWGTTYAEERDALGVTLTKRRGARIGAGQ